MHGLVSGGAFGSSAMPAYTLIYRAAERLFRVHAFDEVGAQLFDRHIGDYQIEPLITAPDRDLSCTIEIKSARSKPEVPDGLVWREIVGGSCAVEGERIYLVVEDSLIAIGPRGATSIQVWVGQRQYPLHPLSLATVLSYAVNAAMRQCGRFELHAAGLMPPAASAGALIIGDSGSGKSTLTMRLISGGWRYLSDDRLLLGEAADGITAWSWRRVFSLTEETLKSCSEPHLDEAMLGAALNDPGKRHLEPRVLFPALSAVSCKPRALFFTKLSGKKESRVVKLTPPEAMTGLLRQSPWVFYDPSSGPDHSKLLAQLVRQSRAYRLLAGRELVDEPERAALLLGPYLN